MPVLTKVEYSLHVSRSPCSDIQVLPRTIWQTAPVSILVPWPGVLQEFDLVRAAMLVYSYIMSGAGQVGAALVNPGHQPNTAPPPPLAPGSPRNLAALAHTHTSLITQIGNNCGHGSVMQTDVTAGNPHFYIGITANFMSGSAVWGAQGASHASKTLALAAIFGGFVRHNGTPEVGFSRPRDDLTSSHCMSHFAAHSRQPGGPGEIDSNVAVIIKR